MDVTSAEPTIVKVKRLKKNAMDMQPEEEFVGFLVDEEGNAVESPEIGKGIYIAAPDAEDEAWLFASDPVWRLATYMEYWLVMTEKGSKYEVRHQKLLQ